LSGPLASLRRVLVGSMNPPKVAAVRAALSSYAASAEVEGVAVESGVPDQPVGFAEIVQGARNRAAAAARSGACDLAVGIEDGLASLPGVEGETLNLGCASVTDGRRESFGLSAAFAYPPACLEPALREREPIGALFDALWSRSREEDPADLSSSAGGNVGKLSLGALPRSEYLRHAVLCALFRFLHPDLYREPERLPFRTESES
jgi:inosine/xanthosine triphosphatase